MTDMLLSDDNPSDSDLLGFVDVAAPVLEAIRRGHLDPVCVGVFGPWGSGSRFRPRSASRRSLSNCRCLITGLRHESRM